MSSNANPSGKFDSSNPDHLVYETDLLRITVLGGIKTEGLDRMRVTLKTELPDSPRPPVRHNLDLYNDNQLEQYIRKVAEKLEVGTSVTSACLSELISELENYRLEQLRAESPDTTSPKTLSEAEHQEAVEYASRPELMQRTMNDLQQSGIIGEEKNSMIVNMAMTSRQCADPLSVICLSGSGTGKSYLMEKVAECFPEEDLMENTQITEQSFYYFRREEIRGKVFLIEDLDGAQGVLYPMRELQTKKQLSKRVTLKDKNGRPRTVQLTVEGPVSVVGCTTRERVYEDNANRSLLIYLDNSPEQDQKIQEYHKRAKAGLIDTQKEARLRTRLQNVQRVLEPVKVVNPYAPEIDLPKEVFKPRRTMGLLLNFIEAVTFYHQYQRPQKTDPESGEVYIETTPEDIEWSFYLLRETLFRKSDELSGACRSFYEWLKSWIQTREQSEFFASDIRAAIRIHPRTLNRYLRELSEYDRVQITGGNKHKSGYKYKLNPSTEPEHLQGAIDRQIAAILENIKASHEARTAPKKKSKTKTNARQQAN